ncbi:hypothetical protein H5410_028075 [Solanum commersonii]|uniref:Uncharacterized protein n=1 Tax=Solanum commersonii TaxID=4109 RepID=A0A9J5Z3X5_SOLCO|nr:hypothetical protein H5410_028075 [Solanum commersonii]
MKFLKNDPHRLKNDAFFSNFNIVRIYHSTRLLVCLIFFVISWLKTVKIVISELHEMHIAHIVSIGSESLCTLNPDGADYIAAQRPRQRLMYFHMEIFKKLDIIVTPTTGSICCLGKALSSRWISFASDSLFHLDVSRL